MGENSSDNTEEDESGKPGLMKVLCIAVKAILTEPKLVLGMVGALV